MYILCAVLTLWPMRLAAYMRPNLLTPRLPSNFGTTLREQEVMCAGTELLFADYVFATEWDDASAATESDGQTAGTTAGTSRSGSKVPSRMMAGMYIINESLFTTGGRLCVPDALRDELMTEVHQNDAVGHRGATSMYQQLIRRLYWPGMERGVRTHEMRRLRIKQVLDPKALGQAPTAPAANWTLQSVTRRILLPLLYTRRAAAPKRPVTRSVHA